MNNPPLVGLRILVVEDEYFLADELKETLIEAGAGLVRLSGEFLDAVHEVENDGYSFTLLDINLRGEMTYANADILMRTAVPFGFVTGYSKRDLPTRFARVPCWEKPISHRGWCATSNGSGLRREATSRTAALRARERHAPTTHNRNNIGTRRSRCAK